LLLKAQVVVEAWRVEYNTYSPHSALDDLTPAEVRAAWTNQRSYNRWTIERRPVILAPRRSRGRIGRFAWRRDQVNARRP
jgi:hypothetical protein